jgi:hypothetical protein
VARRDGGEDGLYRARKPVGERLLRELQLKAAGRVPERRNLLLAEGDQGAGGAVASSLQHRATHTLTGLQTTGARGLGGQEHGVWRSGNRYALPTSPHPRLRLSINKNSRATLTMKTGTKDRADHSATFGQINSTLTSPPSREMQVARKISF